MGVDCYGFNPVIKEGSSKPIEMQKGGRVTPKRRYATGGRTDCGRPGQRPCGGRR